MVICVAGLYGKLCYSLYGKMCYCFVLSFVLLFCLVFPCWCFVWTYIVLLFCVVFLLFCIITNMLRPCLVLVLQFCMDFNISFAVWTSLLLLSLLSSRCRRYVFGVAIILGNLLQLFSVGIWNFGVTVMRCFLGGGGCFLWYLILVVQFLYGC